MSGSRRWWIAPKLYNPIDPVEACYFYAYHEPGDPKRLEIEVMPVAEHEKLMAEKDAEIRAAKTLDVLMSDNGQICEMYDEIDQLEQTIAKQARVIEKLTEQRNFEISLSYENHMTIIRERDAEIAAIERSESEAKGE